MRKVRESLEEELFYTDRYLRASLLEARRLSYMISTDIKFYRADNLKETKRFNEFKEEQDYYRFSELDTNIATYEELIKKQIVEDCKVSLKDFKENNRIPSDDDMDQERPPLLIGDDTNKDMPYTQEATIKTHFKRLKKFIKVIDYLIAEGKLKMILNSTESLKNQIERMNEASSEAVLEHKAYRGDTWLFCDISFNAEATLEYTPPYETIKRMFKELVNKGLIRICKKHRPLLFSPELQIYNEKDLDSRPDETKIMPGVEMQNILYSNEGFEAASNQLFANIERAFDLVI